MALTKEQIKHLSFGDINHTLNSGEASIEEVLNLLEFLRGIGGEALIIHCKTCLPNILQEHHKVTSEHMQ